ncbi:MAG: hypothetical protein ACI978_002285 [Oleispira sp.]|jgi:hypothetical protein
MIDKTTQEEICEELKELIKAEKELSQEKFANDYYCYVTGNNSVDDSKLEAHFDRFKSRIKKGTDTRSPEIISSYLRFFKDKYCKDGTHSPSDRDAAWSMYVELDTRIATNEFIHGDIESALSSLAAIFSMHRDISKQHGHRCRRYYALTSKSLNEQLRPFTSKYHEQIKQQKEINSSTFKEELIEVQAGLQVLKDELLKIAE